MDRTSSDDRRDHSAAGVPCPRCGYDQRGVMNLWTEACPLNGVCAECGLEYRWAELLRPEKFEPRWCVEFASRGVWNISKSCFKTAIRTLWPWSVWKRLNMAFEMRWRRIVLFWIALFFPLLGIYVLEQTAVAVQVWLTARNQIASYAPARMPTLQELEAHLQYLESIEIPEEFDAAGGWQNWNDERREEAIEDTKRMIQNLQRLPSDNTTKPTMRQPLWRAVTEAVLMPRRTTSAGSFIGVGRGGVFSYPAPASLHDALREGYNNYATSEAIEFIYFVGTISLALFILMPLEFALLPMSRRKAKVRWRHIWRVAAYLFAPLMFWTHLIAVTYSIGLAAPNAVDITDRLLSFLAFPPAFIIIIWWAVAIKRYLRMPNGWLIAPVFAVLAILLGAFTVGVIGAALFG